MPPGVEAEDGSAASPSVVVPAMVGEGGADPKTSSKNPFEGEGVVKSVEDEATGDGVSAFTAVGGRLGSEDGILRWEADERVVW